MIELHGWKAFPAVAMGTSLLSGVQTLVSGGAGLGSLAPNIVCFGLLSRGGMNSGDKSSGRSGAAARGQESHWLGGADEYLTALQTCVFFGKSLLVARGFDQAAAASTLLEDNRCAAAGNSAASGSGGISGNGTRHVDVWVFPADGAGGVRGDTRSRGDTDAAMHIDVSDEESDDCFAGDGTRVPTQSWSSDSTVSLSLQLA